MRLSDALPGLFDRTTAGQLNSLSVVLSQEIDRFNKLTAEMRVSLVELQKAIKGLVVMNSDFELMFQSLLINQARSCWLAWAPSTAAHSTFAPRACPPAHAL